MKDEKRYDGVASLWQVVCIAEDGHWCQSGCETADTKVAVVKSRYGNIM